MERVNIRIDTRIHLIGFVLLAVLCAPVAAQDKPAPASATAPAAASAPVVTPAPAAAAKPPVPQVAEAKADAPKQKRVTKRRTGSDCTKLDDPWGNVCAIKKNAEVACRDLPTGKKAARKSKKDAPTTTENKRMQCIDGYMRNV